MRIAVIGAGSIGAHVAHRLSVEGADVVLLEAGKPCHGTSRTSFAWLSSFPQRSWPEEAGRAALRARVDRKFDLVEEELGQRFVSWTGCITIARGDDIPRLRRSAEVCRDKGVDVVEVSADELVDLEPLVTLPEGEAAFFEKESGWVDVERLVSAVIDNLAARGHRVLTETAVVGFRQVGERITAVQTSTGETIEVDAVVNAAGSWATHVAALAGLTIPVDLVPGRIAYTPPLDPEHMLRRIVNTPVWGARPHATGGLAINARGALPKGGKGHGPNLRHAGDLVATLGDYLPGLPDDLTFESRVGIRPIPEGGPIIGSLPWLPNLYHTISHGGIGWAPTWGWVAAEELLHGRTVPEVEGMRPMRFHRELEELGTFADDAEQLASKKF